MRGVGRGDKHITPPFPLGAPSPPLRPAALAAREPLRLLEVKVAERAHRRLFMRQDLGWGEGGGGWAPCCAFAIIINDPNRHPACSITAPLKPTLSSSTSCMLARNAWRTSCLSAASLPCCEGVCVESGEGAGRVERECVRGAVGVRTAQHEVCRRRPACVPPPK